MPEVTAELLSKVSDIPADQWDALNPRGNPFVSHAFLSALEESGSVGPGTGWSPSPIIIRDADGVPAAALPAYLKSHSQGEYVFDHHWADAFERAGGRYYPKLQIAAPFSPVPGPRLLLRDPALAPALLGAVESILNRNGLSSAHATFVEEAELDQFRAAGWLTRIGTQFHWQNRGYADFDGFLAALSSRKRKAIRKERAAAQSAVRIEQIAGADITPEMWDAFWIFYQDTGARKWGQPYLTREFFDIIGESMKDSIVLFLAYDGDRPSLARSTSSAPIASMAVTGAAPATCRSCISNCAIIRPSITRLRTASPASRRARRANINWRVVIRRWRLTRRITSPIRVSARCGCGFSRTRDEAMEREIEFLGEMAPFKKI